MGKTLIAAAAAVLALSATAAPASAQSFAPVNTFVELKGVLTIDQGPIIDCDVKVRYFIDPVGDAFFISATFSSLSNPFCGFVIQPTSMWTLTPLTSVPWPQVLMHMSVQTLAGSCSGFAVLPYDNVTGEMTFTFVSLSGSPSTCWIDGVLTAAPILTVVP